MYVIRKRFRFEAAHHLEGLRPDHPCMRPHGHSYRVEIVLRGEQLGNEGFLRDYHDLDELKRYIDENFDHEDINVYLGIQTSAENIAKHFFDWCKERWPETDSVSVSETEKTWATYSA